MAVHGAHEPVDRVQIDTRVGVDPAASEVEHAAAADRGQLMPVADQRNPGTGLIRDGQQGAGGVLIQHPCLIDKQQTPGRSRASSPPPRYTAPVTGSTSPGCRRVQAPVASQRQPCCQTSHAADPARAPTSAMAACAAFNVGVTTISR